jgi:hypothetical protein
LGTYGDFTITDSTADFVVTDHNFTVTDITNSTSINYGTINITTATLTASATTVGSGWTNFLQTMGDTGPSGPSDQTWTFGQDGNLTIPGGITKGNQTLTLTDATNINSLVIGVENTGSDLILGSVGYGIAVQSNGSVILGSAPDSEAPTVMYGAPGFSDGVDGGDVLILGGNSQTGYNGSVIVEGDSILLAADNYVQAIAQEVVVLTAGEYTWFFGYGGNIEFPDGTNQYTAWQGSTIVSDTAPEDDLGRLWFNSTDGRMYVKYNDNWVDASPQVVPSPEKYLEGLTIEDTTIAKTTYADGKSISIDNEGKAVELKTTGELQVPGDLNPETTSVQKLGTATKRWKEAYIDEIHTVIDGGGASTWLTAD